MKLHIYAYATNSESAAGADFELPEMRRLLSHWCNHPSLFDFFETLYFTRDGGKELFRGTTVRITEEDISRLAEKVAAGHLPRNSDWIFGDVDSSAVQSYETFLEYARIALKRGEYIVIHAV